MNAVAHKPDRESRRYATAADLVDQVVYCLVALLMKHSARRVLLTLLHELLQWRQREAIRVVVLYGITQQ